MTEYLVNFLYLCCDVMRGRGRESLLSDDFMRQCDIATCQAETCLSGPPHQRVHCDTGSKENYRTHKQKELMLTYQSK